jgi:low affinity Fe/Cu permease
MSHNASSKRSSSAGWFNRFAVQAARIVGSPAAFLFAISSVVIWFALGPVFRWSNAWQLIINSITNLVTYLVVFVIQNSQNRDSDAINLKLNELIAANQNASNDLINAEQLSDEALDSLFEKYDKIREERNRRRG